MRAFIASACAFVMRPAFRFASTWSIAAALVASWSFAVEMPRCPATRARKLSPRVAELFDAAMAPPAPTASARPAVMARTRFESRFFIGFLSSDRTVRFEATAGRWARPPFIRWLLLRDRRRTRGELHVDRVAVAVSPVGDLQGVARLVRVDGLLDVFGRCHLLAVDVR